MSSVPQRRCRHTRIELDGLDLPCGPLFVSRGGLIDDVVWMSRGAASGRLQEALMSNPVVIDNDAVLVTRIDDAAVTARPARSIRHRDAVLVGVRDGGGAVCHRQTGEDRYFPVARGRVDWLPAGELQALPGSPPFGEVMLV